jgi:integrase
MPADADELHRILGLLISTPTPGGEGLERQSQTVAGAQLCFQALTGLRSGEPGFLRWDARRKDSANEPGYRYTGRQHEHLAVKRLKGGKNPAVEIHPALHAFLAAWTPYARATWPASPWMFPDPTDHSRPLIDPEDGRRRLNQALTRAATALGLPERHPHSMRAFYVRVRRSQGIRDAVIAEELGQGSGPRQIEQSYGAPDDCYDDGLHDWQPTAAVRPCWELLTTPQTNLISLTPDTVLESKQDTTSTVPQSPAESQCETQKSRANG